MSYETLFLSTDQYHDWAKKSQTENNTINLAQVQQKKTCSFSYQKYFKIHTNYE